MYDLIDGSLKLQATEYREKWSKVQNSINNLGHINLPDFFHNTKSLEESVAISLNKEGTPNQHEHTYGQLKAATAEARNNIRDTSLTRKKETLEQIWKNQNDSDRMEILKEGTRTAIDLLNFCQSNFSTLKSLYFQALKDIEDATTQIKSKDLL